MPAQQDILRGLSHIANEFLPLAVVWHLAIGVALLAVVAGTWRPSRRAAGALLALPLLSASAAAWTTGNLFNGVLLLLVGAALVFTAWRERSLPVRRGPLWAVAAGTGAITFAWVYPHFLSGHHAWVYLFAAPLGLVPCPTLTAVVGFGLLAGGFGSRWWSLTVALAGLGYSLFGVLHLGVWIDAALLVASALMLSFAFRASRAENAFAARALHPDASTR